MRSSWYEPLDEGIGMDAMKRARELGFDAVSQVTADMVPCKKELRELCDPKECIHYGTCWSCPPGAGAFEECVARIKSAKNGIVVQTKRDGVDFSDAERLERISAMHNERLDRLAADLREVHGFALGFSTGGCDLCTSCTYPDAPCAKPVQQRLALSAHGVDVVELCERADMEYGFQNGTIRFIGLVLY